MNAVLTKFGLELNAPSLENLMGTIQSASPPHVPASILQTTSSNLCDLASLREKNHLVQTLRLRPRRLCVFARKKNHPSNLCACALCDLASLREKKSPFQALRLSVFARKKITLPNSALAPSAP